MGSFHIMMLKFRVLLSTSPNMPGKLRGFSTMASSAIRMQIYVHDNVSRKIVEKVAFERTLFRN